MELVRERISNSGFEGIAGHRIVLTGGASQLPGMREIVQEKFKKQVRVGKPLRVNGLADSVSGPAFSTCVGLLSYAIDTGFDRSKTIGSGQNEPTGMLGRVSSWIRENF